MPIITKLLRISRYHANDKNEAETAFREVSRQTFAKISTIYITYRVYFISTADIDNMLGDNTLWDHCSVWGSSLPNIGLASLFTYHYVESIL